MTYLTFKKYKLKVRQNSQKQVNITLNRKMSSCRSIFNITLNLIKLQLKSWNKGIKSITLNQIRLGTILTRNRNKTSPQNLFKKLKKSKSINLYFKNLFLKRFQKGRKMSCLIKFWGRTRMTNHSNKFWLINWMRVLMMKTSSQMTMIPLLILLMM